MYREIFPGLANASARHSRPLALPMTLLIEANSRLCHALRGLRSAPRGGPAGSEATLSRDATAVEIALIAELHEKSLER